MALAEYLGDWLDAHALEVKPRTLAGYRYLVRQYVVPRIGDLRLQAIRPTTLSGLYRDLLAGGRNGTGCLDGLSTTCMPFCARRSTMLSAQSNCSRRTRLSGQSCPGVSTVDRSTSRPPTSCAASST
ncbi:hypothetical protein [Kribbella sp. NPDC049227]|uniref:hypothetical protein n=1 Tax=Kribbella sp. NPDC049227 TaxID=3364113 RepID=UPI00371FCF82